jgi:hypothetical protein
MGAYANPDSAFPGLGYGLEVGEDRDTAICQEPNGIPFGSAVFSLKGSPNQCWQPHIDMVSGLLSGALSGSNVWTLQVSFTTAGSNGSLTGGTMLTTASLAITYASSASATMTAMINAFNADSAAVAAGATMSSADTTHFVIAITPTAAIPMSDINIVACSVAGGDAVTFTNTYSTQMVFMGIAGFEQRAMRTLGAGNIYYEQYASVNTVRKGRLWVVCANTVSAEALAYIIIGGTNRGKFTDSASPLGGTIYLPQSPQGAATSTPSGIQPIFRSAPQTINSQALAQIDVRGIY